MYNLKKLQSGTDIRGIAIQHKDLDVNLTENEVMLLMKGFFLWLKEKNNDKQISVAIGCDSRLSGEKLKKCCIDTLVSLGVTVYDCGLATTPAMFMTTVINDYICTGSVMITASHLPYYYNGLKFFTKDGGCEKEDISQIINLSSKDIEVKEGIVKKVDLIKDYSDILIEKIRKGTDKSKNTKPLNGLKIIVDAGNGSGGFFCDKVLKPLGADTTGSQFLNPDGNFPNHIPNPEDEEAMNSITKAVLDNKADLGIIFDTDVDRAAIVSKDGNKINKNALIAMISAIILEEYPKSTIVTDSITSDGLKSFIENLGGNHYRFKRGYKNVINEAIKLNEKGIESQLAIETSGHAAIKENYFLDDGAYLIAKILIKMANMNAENKDIMDLIKNLEYPKESMELRIKINMENFTEYAEKILEDIKDFAESRNGWSLVQNNFEGVKVYLDKNNGDGWFLIRKSLHEPLIAINIESNEINGGEKIINELKGFLNKYSNLDLNFLNN